MAGAQSKSCKLAFYSEVIAVRDRIDIPIVTYSIDHRTYEIALQVYNDSQPISLNLFLCAQIKPDIGDKRYVILMHALGFIFEKPFHVWQENPLFDNCFGEFGKQAVVPEDTLIGLHTTSASSK